MLSRITRISGLAALIAMVQTPSTFARSTSEVWEHHIQAWDARSLEGIVSDYSEESVVILNNQIFRGKDQISVVFKQLFKIFDSGANQIEKPVVLDRFVYITWRFAPKGKQEFFGTDTFLIEEGKISLQTIASPLYESHSVSKPGSKNPPEKQSIDGVVLKNRNDLTWVKMLPHLGEDSPVYSILRVDPKTKETTLMIEFPKAIYIPKHTHNKSETHIILGGSHLFEHQGKRFDVKEHGYIYMPGKFVHEAWVPAGAKAMIILEDGWKVDWLEGGPKSSDLGKVPPVIER